MLKTGTHMNNEKNLLQLQKTVYQNMTPYFDKINVCILRARTPE